MANQERVYLTAISVVAGIITLIDVDGQIVNYRQRGIGKYSDKQLKVLMSTGLLNPSWKMYKELPKNISISFEDPEIMGRAQATYPNPEKIARELSNLGLSKEKPAKKAATNNKTQTRSKGRK